MLRVFVVYDIQKVNTDDEINFYMSYNEEKGKSHKDSLELRILYFILVLGTLYNQGGALGELMKCKTSKSILPSKSPVRPDISSPLAGFQRLWPSMSGPLPYPGLT
jgi:hypothetical protein